MTRRRKNPPPRSVAARGAEVADRDGSTASSPAPVPVTPVHRIRAVKPRPVMRAYGHTLTAYGWIREGKTDG